jgi:prolyl-tRNA editing enzyme YbaK/EbsC (Cys-tRNA(Pro) deacylase)
MPKNANILLPAVRNALEQAGMKYEVLVCRDDLADTAAFCEYYGYTPEQSANTILIANRRNDDHMVACLVLADSKLDVNKTVARLMDTKKISFASAEVTHQTSGMEIGGVTLFGLPRDMQIYIDSRVMLQPMVVMGGGNRTSKVLIAPDELQKLPNVHVIEGLGRQKEA